MLDLLPKDYPFENEELPIQMRDPGYEYHQSRLFIGDNEHCRMWAYLRREKASGKKTIIFVSHTNDKTTRATRADWHDLRMVAPFSMLVSSTTKIDTFGGFIGTLSELVKLLFLVTGREKKVFTVRPTQAHGDVARVLRTISTASGTSLNPQAEITPSGIHDSQSVLPIRTTGSVPLMSAPRFGFTTTHPERRSADQLVGSSETNGGRTIRIKQEMPPSPASPTNAPLLFTPDLPTESNVGRIERTISHDLPRTVTQPIRADGQNRAERSRADVSGDISLVAKQLHEQEMEDAARKKQLKDAMKQLKKEKADLKARKRTREQTLQRLLGERRDEVLAQLAQPQAER